MKIGIIAANNIRLSPYVFYYTNILDSLNIEYEVIAPTRNVQLQSEYDFSVHMLSWDEHKSTFLNYISYSNNVKKYSVGRFDFLIVLTTVNAVFCAGWLKCHFRNRYIVDIRDYTHEDNVVFYWIEKRALKNARACVISSPKFKSFLPEGEYWVCHNINTPPEDSEFCLSKSDGRIIIGYVGAVGYSKSCRKIMQLVSEDERFEFHVYGSGVAENEIREYAHELSCDRIRLFGAYKPADKGNIIQKVNILFNVYGNGTPLLDYALSNKLYDALYYRKPILTSINTYMAEISSGISFSVDLDNKNCLNEIWGWYQNLDKDKVESFAALRFAELQLENRNTIRRLYELMKSL